MLEWKTWIFVDFLKLAAIRFLLAFSFLPIGSPFLNKSTSLRLVAGLFFLLSGEACDPTRLVLVARAGFDVLIVRSEVIVDRLMRARKGSLRR